MKELSVGSCKLIFIKDKKHIYLFNPINDKIHIVLDSIYGNWGTLNKMEILITG
jgi:hypothetical protein